MFILKLLFDAAFFSQPFSIVHDSVSEMGGPNFFASPSPNSLIAVIFLSLGCICLYVTPWTATHQAPLCSTIFCSLLKFISTELVMRSDHLIPCCPLLLFAFSLSQHHNLFRESALCIRWPQFWSFSCSNNPSNKYSGLISFRIDWFDLLAVWGTLKSLLQHHNSKASALVLSFLYGRICLQCGRPGFNPWKKGMITRSSIFTWRIPWTMSLAGYSSWGWRVKHDWKSKTILRSL